MAGIGFELRKVINKGGMSSFLQTAMSGAMIVAGPWLLSIITISLINIILNQTSSDGIELFMGVVIYCYAFSLFLFGGFHYLFTRRMSDMLYIKKEGEAFGFVLRLYIPLGIISAVIALPAALLLKPELSSQLEVSVFRASAVMLFTAVNILWVIMLFVSVLKWYIKILLVYTAGLVLSILLVFLLSPILGISGALLGFCISHILIVIMLTILCRAAWKPRRPRPSPDINPSTAKNPIIAAAANFGAYIRKYKYLFAAGIFYYAGIWIDKLIYWAAYGDNVSATFIRLYAEYDISVYMANLTMIPGLIFFVIYSETEFYTALKRFINIIRHGLYTDIVIHRNKLAEKIVDSLKEQSLFQGIITLIMIILSSNLIFRTTLSAVFFHLLLLTLINYFFYIEEYNHAFYSALVFFIVNGTLAAITTLGLIPKAPGFSYLIGAAAASATAALLLKADISRLERHILTK